MLTKGRLVNKKTILILVEKIWLQNGLKKSLISNTLLENLLDYPYELFKKSHDSLKSYVTKTTHLDDILNCHIICLSKITSNIFETNFLLILNNQPFVDSYPSNPPPGATHTHTHNMIQSNQFSLSFCHDLMKVLPNYRYTAKMTSQVAIKTL